MANLLPQHDMHVIRKERRLRFVVVVLCALGIVFLVADIFLIPSLVLSQSKEKEISGQVEVLQKFIARRESSDVAQHVRDTRTRLDLLESITSEILVTDLVAVIEEHAGDEIEIRSIGYSYGAESTGGYLGEIAFDGVAQNREALIAFGRRLEAQAEFQDVDIPVSSLAAREDIAFSLQFKVVDSGAPREKAPEA